MLLVGISIMADPFIPKLPTLSVFVFGVAAIVIQVLFFDGYLVEQISDVWKDVEKNGTALDADIQSLTDRLDDLEVIWNVSLR